MPSRFYTPIKISQDSDIFSNELTELAENFEDLSQLSPLRANLLRAFDWNSPGKVLEIGCGAGSITSFLSSESLQVDAIDPDRALAQLAALRTQGVQSARVIAEPFATLDFESCRYDVIILCGDKALLDCMAGYKGMAYGQAAAAVLTACKALLSDTGQLLLAVDNHYGVNYMFAVADQSQNNVYTNFNVSDIESSDQSINRTQWCELLTGSFKHVKEYYLFPDIYFSRVLLGRDYVEANPNATTGYKSNTMNKEFPSKRASSWSSTRQANKKI